MLRGAWGSTARLPVDIWAAVLLLIITTASTSTSTPWSHYEGVVELTQQNLTSMASALRSMPIKHYRYLFDTAGDRRRRLGPLPHDVVVPSALRVLQVSEMVAPSPRGGAQANSTKSAGLNLGCLLDEMSVVDETVLFTYAVAATKVLTRRVEALARSAEEVWRRHEATAAAMAEMSARANSSAITTLGSIELVRKNVTARAMLADSVPELVEARRRAGEAKRAVMRRRWEVKKKSVAERLASEVTAIEAALEGHRAALRTEEELERAALQGDSSGAREARLEILAAARRVEEARLSAELERALATTRAEAEAHEQLQTMHHQLALERLQAQAAEDRRYLQQVAGLVLEGGAAGVLALTSDWTWAASLILAGLLLAVGTLVTHDAVVLAREVLSRRWERPRLVRARPRRASSTATGGRASVVVTGEEGRPPVRPWSRRGGLVLSAALESQLADVVEGVRRARAQGLPLRHVLVHGPPGNGKSMLVEALCEAVGLEVCVIGGSDFGPLGEMGAAEVHRIFEWAARSAKGLMVVIEEAESALGDRRRQRMSDWRRSILNAVLWYTGEESRQHMLVVVTNRPGDLDRAVLDRMDVVMEVEAPALPERCRLLQAFFHTFLSHVPLPAAGAEQQASLLQGLAMDMEGFSCREVEKLVLAIQRPSLLQHREAAGSGASGQGATVAELLALARTLITEVKANRQASGRTAQGSWSSMAHGDGKGGRSSSSLPGTQGGRRGAAAGSRPPPCAAKVPPAHV